MHNTNTHIHISIALISCLFLTNIGILNSANIKNPVSTHIVNANSGKIQNISKNIVQKKITYTTWELFHRIPMISGFIWKGSPYNFITPQMYIGTPIHSIDRDYLLEMDAAPNQKILISPLSIPPAIINTPSYFNFPSSNYYVPVTNSSTSISTSSGTGNTNIIGTEITGSGNTNTGSISTGTGTTGTGTTGSGTTGSGTTGTGTTGTGTTGSGTTGSGTTGTGTTGTGTTGSGTTGSGTTGTGTTGTGTTGSGTTGSGTTGTGTTGTGTTGTGTTIFVAGSCGGAHATIVTELSGASLNLCNSGSVSDFTGSGPWTWSCMGSGGGENVDCAATDSTHSLTAPIATLDIFTTEQDQISTFDLIKNDISLSGLPLAVAGIYNGPTNGNLTITGGTVTYTPNMGYCGTDSFSYTVKDIFNTGSTMVPVGINVNCTSKTSLTTIFPTADMGSLLNLGKYCSQNPNTKPSSSISVNTDWIAHRVYINGVEPIRVSPNDCDIVRQSPPIFIWPDYEQNSSAYTFDFELYKTGSISPIYTKTITDYKNTLSLDFALSPGEYEWRVRVNDSTRRVAYWSQYRRFYILPSASAYFLPTEQNVLDRIDAINGKHPRTAPIGDALTALRAINLGTSGARHADFVSRSNKYLPGNLMSTDIPSLVYPEPFTLSGIYNYSGSIVTWGTVSNYGGAAGIKNYLFRITNLITEASVIYTIDPTNTGARDFAKSRALALASWNGASGSITSMSVMGDDQLVRAIGLHLATVYDWLYNEFTPAERAQLQRAINERYMDLSIMSVRPYRTLGGIPQSNTGNVTGRIRFMIEPFDSHGIGNMRYLAYIASTIVGDTANTRYGDDLRNMIPAIYTLQSGWGMNDGGFGNSIGYTVWYTENAHRLQMIQDFMGVSIFSQQWYQNHINFAAHFLSPTIPANSTMTTFGDEGNSYANFGWAKAGYYGLFIPLVKDIHNNLSEMSKWFLKNLIFTPEFHYFRYLIPVDIESIPTADISNIPSSAVFPDIGLVSIQDNLDAYSGATIGFRSSYYGSINHNHADQNSFTIAYSGIPLANDTGYYDGYNDMSSRHRNEWTIQTLAHNAITYNEGKGQANDSAQNSVIYGAKARGDITYYLDTPLATITTGDATPAYMGQFSDIKRTLVYLKGMEKLVVFDTMTSSGTNKIMEWNLHGTNTYSTITPDSGFNLAISETNSGVSLCTHIASPDTISFAQNNLYQYKDGSGALINVPPSGPLAVNTWHARFSTNTPISHTTFATLMDIQKSGSCTTTSSTITSLGGDDWQISTNGRTITYMSGTVDVQ